MQDTSGTVAGQHDWPEVWLTPGSISVAVDRLEKKALVKRKNTGDRRVRLVELTAKGRRLITKTFSGTRVGDGSGRRSPFKRGAADVAAAPQKTGKRRR